MADTVTAHNGRPIQLTVSIGVAALRPGKTIELWLSRADNALYEVKRGGGNRCSVAQ